MLDIFAIVVLLVLAATGIWLLVLIGNIPGNMARAAGHPQAEAIMLLGWVGILTMGIGWFIALVWAKTVPPGDAQALQQRISVLEQRVEQLGGQS